MTNFYLLVCLKFNICVSLHISVISCKKKKKGSPIFFIMSVTLFKRNLERLFAPWESRMKFTQHPAAGVIIQHTYK